MLSAIEILDQNSGSVPKTKKSYKNNRNTDIETQKFIADFYVYDDISGMDPSAKSELVKCKKRSHHYHQS